MSTMKNIRNAIGEIVTPARLRTAGEFAAGIGSAFLLGAGVTGVLEAFGIPSPCPPDSIEQAATYGSLFLLCGIGTLGGSADRIISAVRTDFKNAANKISKVAHATKIVTEAATVSLGAIMLGISSADLPIALGQEKFSCTPATVSEDAILAGTLIAAGLGTLGGIAYRHRKRRDSSSLLSLNR